jgi:hypothetical protein
MKRFLNNKMIYKVLIFFQKKKSLKKIDPFEQ